MIILQIICHALTFGMHVKNGMVRCRTAYCVAVMGRTTLINNGKCDVRGGAT